MDATTHHRRLLIAYDGTAPARRAVARAASVVRPGDEVSVLNVMPEPGVSSRWDPGARERQAQAVLLAEARRALACRGVRARAVAAVGSPVAETLSAARRLGADLIVVGVDSGRSGRRSAGARIARRAPCDVMVVRSERPVVPDH